MAAALYQKALEQDGKGRILKIPERLTSFFLFAVHLVLGGGEVEFDAFVSGNQRLHEVVVPILLDDDRHVLGFEVVEIEVELLRAVQQADGADYPNGIFGFDDSELGD